MMSFFGKKERFTLAVGFTYVLLGIFLALWVALFNVGWVVQHPVTAGSFLLCVECGLTLILYAPVNMKTVVSRASEEGINISEAEKKELLQAIRDCRILLIGVLTAYTIVFILHIYYLDSIQFFPDSDFAIGYMALLYVIPVFIVIPLVLGYLNFGRRHRNVSHIYIGIGSTKSRKK